MQTIYISQAVAWAIYCPFCGQKVLDEEKAPDINPCLHTLFIGTDEGFEYASDRFELSCDDLLEGGFKESDIHTPMRDLVISDSVCFELEPVPPSMLSTFVGFVADNLPYDSDDAQ